VKAFEQWEDHTQDAPNSMSDLSLSAAARLNHEVDVGAFAGVGDLLEVGEDNFTVSQVVLCDDQAKLLDLGRQIKPAMLGGRVVLEDLTKQIVPSAKVETCALSHQLLYNICV
jgi:hypothetical protein